MDEKARLTGDEAVEILRKVMSIEENVPAAFYPVLHLLNTDRDYYLVIFYLNQRSIGIGTVEMKNGRVNLSAKLPGTEEHLNIKAEDALAISGLPAESTIDLVWQPYSMSRSPLYPIWRISFGDNTRFVNQQGNMQTTLSNMGKG